jgi:hypothetical protein
VNLITSIAQPSGSVNPYANDNSPHRPRTATDASAEPKSHTIMPARVFGPDTRSRHGGFLLMGPVHRERLLNKCCLGRKCFQRYSATGTKELPSGRRAGSIRGANGATGTGSAIELRIVGRCRATQIVTSQYASGSKQRRKIFRMPTQPSLRKPNVCWSRQHDWARSQGAVTPNRLTRD